MEFEKKFDINSNRKLMYQKDSHTYSLREAILGDGKLDKTYCLFKGDDYGFTGWTPSEKQDINKISFEFDINHPLYMPLFHLLNYDDELLIDDDDSVEDNKKYMLIHKGNDKIYVDFINELDNDNFDINKFRVFIKNIVFDGRSKIDQEQKDTKTRLNAFFNEAHNVLSNDYHQVSFEEWLLRDSTNDEVKQLKKVFKR